VLEVEVEIMTVLKLQVTILLTLGQKAVAAVGMVTVAAQEVEHIVGTGVLELEVGKAMAAKTVVKMDLEEVVELALHTVQHMGQELVAVWVGMKKDQMAVAGHVLGVILRME
jgi:hypothetical protein